MIKPGTIVFATWDCPEGRKDAMRWISDHGLTPDQVRLYVHDGMVLVSAKKSLYIHGSGV